MSAEGLRVLHLTLHRKWFRKILRGLKKEEYRDPTPYWDKRLEFKTFDVVRFVNGYGKDKPFMVVEFDFAHRCKSGWIIHLGKILETGNLPPTAAGRE